MAKKNYDIPSENIDNATEPKANYKDEVLKNSKIDSYPGVEKTFDKYVHESKGDYIIAFDDNNCHTVIYFNPVLKRVKQACYKIGEQ